MKQIVLTLVVFISGMLVSYVLWTPSKSIERIEHSTAPVSQPDFESKMDKDETAVRELRSIASRIHQRLDKLEKKLEQSSTSSRLEQSETQGSADSMDAGLVISAYGKTIAIEQNETTMSQAINYVYSKIDQGSWSRDDARYIQSISDQLTKEQLIDIQLSLNEAINKDQMTIDFDLAIHPIF